MSNIYLIAFWIDRPSTLFAVISYDMCTVCIIYLISYVFWFQNLHFQHIWKGMCYNKRTTAYFKKSAFPLIKPLHYFCLSNLLFWWNRIFSLALNGGGRFLSPSSPLSSLLCSLVSWETLSALLSKLKYYGLTGLLMQLTLSKLGFRGTWQPWRNVRSRLYDGAWERWRIVCLAALSVEDIDIYLFGTMITGILLIGLGFALGYRRIQKTETAVQSPTRLPVWLKQWEERSALRLRL